MERETVIMLAKECGGEFHGPHIEHLSISEEDFIYKLIPAVAAAVKEEDARICEDLPIMIGKRLTTPDDCAAAIRASIEEVKS